MYVILYGKNTRSRDFKLQSPLQALEIEEIKHVEIRDVTPQWTVVEGNGVPSIGSYTVLYVWTILLKRCRLEFAPSCSTVSLLRGHLPDSAHS